MAVLEHKANDYICSKCGAKNRKDNVNCWKCGIEFKEIVGVDEFSYPRGDKEIEPEFKDNIKSEKYSALKTILGINITVANKIIIACIIGGLSFFVFREVFSIDLHNNYGIATGYEIINWDKIAVGTLLVVLLSYLFVCFICFLFANKKSPLPYIRRFLSGKGV